MRILSLISISNALETMEYTLCIYTQSYNIHMQSYIYAQSFMCVCVCVCVYIYIYIWFFTRMYGTCYWTFGNCYNSQIETDASCGAVCVCVEVLEATHWALLGSETQESILEWAVPQRRRARDWLGGKLEWPWPAWLLQSPEWGASSDCQQIHPTPPALFLEGMWCTNGHVCWFLSHT